MNSRLFWRAAWIQLLVVAVTFAVLGIALPHRFFVDWGFAVGPLLWIGCSLVTGDSSGCRSRSPSSARRPAASPRSW